MTVQVDVQKVVEHAKELVKNYPKFLDHCPKMLRNSMQLAYQNAVDHMLQALDASKVEDPIPMKNEKPVVLLDENGFAG